MRVEADRPSSAIEERLKHKVQSYANKEGVQLRGDKGKARRKSTASPASRMSNFPVSCSYLHQ